MSISDDIVEVGNASLDDVYVQVMDTTDGVQVAEYVGTDMIGTHYITTTLEHMYKIWIIGNNNTAITSIGSDYAWSNNTYYTERSLTLYANPASPVTEIPISQLVIEKVSI